MYSRHIFYLFRGLIVIAYEHSEKTLDISVCILSFLPIKKTLLENPVGRRANARRTPSVTALPWGRADVLRTITKMGISACHPEVQPSAAQTAVSV